MLAEDARLCRLSSSRSLFDCRIGRDVAESDEGTRPLDLPLIADSALTSTATPLRDALSGSGRPACGDVMLTGLAGVPWILRLGSSMYCIGIGLRATVWSRPAERGCACDLRGLLSCGDHCCGAEASHCSLTGDSGVWGRGRFLGDVVAITKQPTRMRSTKSPRHSSSPGANISAAIALGCSNCAAQTARGMEGLYSGDDCANAACMLMLSQVCKTSKSLFQDYREIVLDVRA